MSVTQFKIAGPLVVSITVIAAMGALAATDPYPTGLVGYDVSYPQCGGTAAAGSFGIVGVNGGRPFTNNSCLGAEYAAAPKSTAPSLYINTGYAAAYRNNITTGCSAPFGVGVRNQPPGPGVGHRVQRSGDLDELRHRTGRDERGGVVARRRDGQQLVIGQPELESLRDSGRRHGPRSVGAAGRYLLDGVDVDGH